MLDEIKETPLIKDLEMIVTGHASAIGGAANGYRGHCYGNMTRRRKKEKVCVVHDRFRSHQRPPDSKQSQHPHYLRAHTFVSSPGV